MPSFEGQIKGQTVVSLLDNLPRTANVAGSLIDVKDFIGGGLIIQAGGVQDTGDDNSTYTVYVQHSATDNASNAVNANITLTALSNVASIVTQGVSFRNLERYVRVVGNIAGANSPSFPIGITLSGYKQIIG